jgi:FkbM family methyltransferase
MRITYGHLAAIVAGLVLATFLNPIIGAGMVATYKLRNAADCCTWGLALKIPKESARFHEIAKEVGATTAVAGRDEALGIVKVHTPTRDFWVKAAGTEMNGATLVPYLLAEQQWLHELRPDWHIRAGDVVVDVGAHVGVFTSLALSKGAAKVVAVEPDTTNLECLRRNFSAEIATGRVVIVPEGAWGSEKDLSFEVGDGNSGTGSLVLESGRKKVRIHVRPIDDMLARAGVSRVNFIKMDIEGAEREALRGAAQTIARSHPRIMLDAYHLPDDPVTLPRVVREIGGAFEVVWGPCSIDETHKLITPHSMLLR